MNYRQLKEILDKMPDKDLDLTVSVYSWSTGETFGAIDFSSYPEWDAIDTEFADGILDKNHFFIMF